jgi:hypothetical protein
LIPALQKTKQKTRITVIPVSGLLELNRMIGINLSDHALNDEKRQTYVYVLQNIFMIVSLWWVQECDLQTSNYREDN